MSRLSARHFRNLSDIEWRPTEGCHLLVGPNGAGKTSILEAVYLVATTRSFRATRISECVQHGATGLTVTGDVVTDHRVTSEVEYGAMGRVRRVNGGLSTAVEHLREFPVIAWTADDVDLLTGPPAKRRRFLDQGIVGMRPAALEVLARYRRGLAQKREVLISGRGTVDPWNELLAPLIANIVSMRRLYLERLARELESVVADCDLDLPGLSLSYRPSIGLQGGQEIEAVRERLAQEAAEERRSGRPRIGPHLDDVDVRWGSHRVRSVSSAGERKAFGLLLTAARGRVLAAAGRPPIFVLDDADSELDAGRLAAIWRVYSQSRQVLVSTNREGVWGCAVGAEKWSVRDGRIEPL